MQPDKFAATWVSHSSIRDYLNCPRAYYLNNVYKDPGSGHKIKIMSPALALGQIVHEVIESLSVLPTSERLKEPLVEKFRRNWKKVSGLKGGFRSEEQERQYFLRGEAMLTRVTHHPGPLARLAVKIQMELPYFWLSEPDNIILCGKLDWLEYLPDDNAVKIVDFKTGKRDEEASSLQLPIYYLLASECQKREVVGVSYWYIERNDELSPKELPDPIKAKTELLKIAKEIKLARKLDRLKCPQGESGCRACRPLEAVVRGKATMMGVNEYNQDIYVVDEVSVVLERESEIL
jgi:CRISPR/Cas system-associated exonuclease Cas4 (RecB family)